jgi:hypothetical protein
MIQRERSHGSLTGCRSARSKLERRSEGTLVVSPLTRTPPPTVNSAVSPVGSFILHAFWDVIRAGLL